MPLKRHPSLIPLSHDHRSLLFLAQLLKKNAPVFKGYPSTPEGKRQYAIESYIHSLAPHFELEEKVVFPMLLTIVPAFQEQISTLVSVHAQLSTYFHQIAQSSTPLIELMNQCGLELEAHIRHEERVFFTQLQELLSEEQLVRLGQKISTAKEVKSA